MTPEQEQAYAARIVEAAVGCNIVNSAVRALQDYQTRDKKLQPQLTALLSQTERVLPRLVRTAESGGVDALNGAANAAAEVGRLLLYLDGPGMVAVVRYAEQLARLASECAPDAPPDQRLPVLLNHLRPSYEQ